MKKGDALEIIKSTHTFRNLPEDLIEILVRSAKNEHYDQECLLRRSSAPWDNLYGSSVNAFSRPRHRNYWVF
jgi:hypothetical protein